MVSDSEGGDRSLFDSDDFRMYSQKVLPCPRRVGHDWTCCPYYHHGEKAQRRCPKTFQYLPIACPDMRKGDKTCPRGDACCFAHNVFEYWLHPSRYRTQLCSFGTGCRRATCFFAHTLPELRQPSALARAETASNVQAALAQVDPTSITPGLLDQVQSLLSPPSMHMAQQQAPVQPLDCFRHPAARAEQHQQCCGDAATRMGASQLNDAAYLPHSHQQDQQALMVDAYTVLAQQQQAPLGGIASLLGGSYAMGSPTAGAQAYERSAVEVAVAALKNSDVDKDALIRMLAGLLEAQTTNQAQPRANPSSPIDTSGLSLAAVSQMVQQQQMQNAVQQLQNARVEGAQLQQQQAALQQLGKYSSDQSSSRSLPFFSDPAAPAPSLSGLTHLLGRTSPTSPSGAAYGPSMAAFASYSPQSQGPSIPGSSRTSSVNSDTPEELLLPQQMRHKATFLSANLNLGGVPLQPMAVGGPTGYRRQ